MNGKHAAAQVFSVWSGTDLMFLVDGQWVTNDVCSWHPLPRSNIAERHQCAVPLKLKRLPGGVGLMLPRKAHKTDAGIDLPCAIDFSLFPDQRMLVPTGFAIELPVGYEGQIRPRSGLAVKDAITVGNAPGTIDANYRGEILVLLINHGINLKKFLRGDRIAQLVVQPVLDVEISVVAELSETDRGTNGFGSSGAA